MKIALGQINVKQGQPTENLAAMREMIVQAKAEEADLIVFPEMALSGYCLQDKWLDQDWCAYLESLNDELLALSQGIGILYGNPADWSGPAWARRTPGALQCRLLLC